MKKVKIFSLALALVMLGASLTACGDKKEADAETTTEAISETSGSTEETTAAQGDNAGENNEAVSEDFFTKGFTATKTGTLNVDRIVEVCGAAVLYKNEDGKYGLMTNDGKNDTGARYAFASALQNENLFIVAEKDKSEITDVSSINCYGIIDDKGNEILPMKYADFYFLSERYVQVFEVSGIASDEDSALCSISTSYHSVECDGYRLHCNGSMFIYDIEAGKKLDFITDADPDSFSAKGNYIVYKDAEGNEITVNHKGEFLPEGANLFSTGDYFLKDEASIAVYDSDNKKMFECSTDDYNWIHHSRGKYYVATKTDTNKDVVLNSEGEIVSVEYDHISAVLGDFVLGKNCVYNFDGDVLVEGLTKSSCTYYTPVFHSVVYSISFLEGDREVLITKEGAVIFDNEGDSTVGFGRGVFVPSKTIDGKKLYYSFADKDFTLDLFYLSDWLFYETDGDTYHVIDGVTGKTLLSLSSGIQLLNVAVNPSVTYIYERTDSGYDVYAIK